MIRLHPFRCFLLLLVYTTLVHPLTPLAPSRAPMTTSIRQPSNLSRRSFVGAIAVASFLIPAFPAWAGMPMVTTDEFLVILRDSFRSVERVEFNGAKSETVTVRLVDGTTFGIKDIVESSTDPRSPLKIAAICRENQIPTKFFNIEAALASAPKRKKMYTNQRVAEAAAKEKERLARMQKDEEERLEELSRMEQ